jgi:hypothetical protein
LLDRLHDLPSPSDRIAQHSESPNFARGNLKTLQTLTAADLTEAFKGTRSLQFKVPEEAVEFAKWLPHLDFEKPTEIPPSPVVLVPDAIAMALLKAGDTLSGHHSAIVLVVYYSGGTIKYQRISSDEYVALVEWPKQ